MRQQLMAWLVGMLILGCGTLSTTAAHPPVTTVTLALSPLPPLTPGTPLTLRATATGGCGVRYHFRLGIPSGGTTKWQTLRPYGTAAACRWTPRQAGTYTLAVWARSAGSHRPSDATAQLLVQVRGRLTGVALTAAPSSGAVGQPFTLTATPAGTAVTPEYVFRGGLQGSTGTTTWLFFRDFATSATCTWTPTQAGTYTLAVRGRESGSTELYEATAALTYQVIAGTPLKHVFLTATPEAPTPGTPTLLMATPEGGTGVEYQFAIGHLSGFTWQWTTAQSFSARTTCAWTPTQPGAYQTMVWARDGSLTDQQELYDARTLVVRTAVPPVELSLARFTGDRPFAVSYTFDDGTRDQLELAIPLFEARGMHATLNIVGNYTGATQAERADTISWQELKTLAARGHEIGNHSQSHPLMTTCTAAQLATEIDGSAARLTTELGTPPYTFAAPFTCLNALVYERILMSHLDVRAPTIPFEGTAFTVDRGKAIVDWAKSEKLWIVPLTHTVTVQSTGSTLAQATLAATLDYLQTQNAWVETYGTISRYVRARDTATLTPVSQSTTSRTFTLTSPLSPAVFTVPLTVLLGSLTRQPTGVQATRGTTALPTRVVPVGTTWTIQVDAVPGAAAITVRWN
jgi:peptidoglycan/xylan/chitin deacetylase (PgdA/CDA1 family)